MSITTADIEQLTREPSAKVRAGVADKIARDFNNGTYSDAEKELAFDIFRLLLKDVEVRIRRALSENLHANLSIPHDIMMRLASDVAEVAIPVLEHSYVLSEEDLIELVKSTKATAKLSAVARRASISRNLSNALMQSQDEEAICTLFANKCASLAEENVLATLLEMKSHPGMLEALVNRGGLSLAFVEKLFTMVSDEMRDKLASQYNLSSKVADDAVDSAREWATLGSITRDMRVEDVVDLVDELKRSGKLTHSIVLRSLCMGDMRFFETAMARMANIPLMNASLLMFDSGPLGFKAMYEAAAMPEGFFDSVRTLHQIALEETDWGRFTHDDFKKRIIQRLIREGHDHKNDDMAYIISIIGNLHHGNTQIH